MPAPRQVIRDAQEADNALNAFLNAPPLAPSLGTPTPVAVEPQPAPAPVEPQPAPAPAPQPAAVPTSSSAELLALTQQMRSLQGQFGSMQQTISEQRAEIERLRSQPAPAPAAPTPTKVELLSEAERNEYGAPFLDVVVRAAREAIEPMLTGVLGRVEALESGVSATKQIAQQANQRLALSAEEQFWQKLDSSVADHEAINDDPRFVAWLQQVPEFGNHSLQQILQHAASTLNAERVIQIFNAYKRSLAPQPTAQLPSTPAHDPVASLVSPSAVAPATVVPHEVSGKIYTAKEIDDFYRAVTRKQIDPAEAARIDADITRALAEGRVR